MELPLSQYTEAKLFAPTEQAYGRFRQALKTYLYERIDWITLDFICRDLIKPEDQESATRDQLASDLFQDILSFFGPRVRREIELNELLEEGLESVYPGLAVSNLVHTTSRRMMTLYIEALGHTRRDICALYVAGRKPDIRWIENELDRQQINAHSSILTPASSSSSLLLYDFSSLFGFSSISRSQSMSGPDTAEARQKDSNFEPPEQTLKKPNTPSH